MHKINTNWMSEFNLWEQLIKYAHDLRPPRLRGRTHKQGMKKLVKWLKWVTTY